MSVIHLTDIVVQCPDSLDHNLPDDPRLFLEVLYTEEETRRIGPLVRESQLSWKALGSIDVATSVPSTRIVVWLEHAGQESTQIGFADLNSGLLLAQCVAQVNVTQVLVGTGNGPALEIRCSCIDIPPDDLAQEAISYINGIREVILGIVENHRETFLDMLPDYGYKQATSLRADDPDKPLSLMLVADMLQSRYTHSKNEGDLHKAISALDHAIELTEDGHPEQAARLVQLGGLLTFRDDPRTSDFDRAISVLEYSTIITPDGHTHKPLYLAKLGQLFTERFKRVGELSDIEKAISANGDAAHLTPDGHAEKPAYLNYLGLSFMDRFERTGKLIDVEKAISAYESVVRLTPRGHADESQYFNNLANSFIRRFEHTGELDDIDKAISTHKDVVLRTPEDHAHKPTSLGNLGAAFLARFDCTGDLVDVNNAILANETAIRLGPDDSKKPHHIDRLGSSFLCRFQHTGELIDLEKAITAHTNVVNITPDGHVDKPTYLNNLGSSLMCRFTCTGDIIDADNAISAFEAALHAAPEGHPCKHGLLSNLGSAFNELFIHTRDVDDINKSILAHKDAVDLTPEHHAEKPGYLSGLGRSLMDRFNHIGKLDDLEQAITVNERAVHLTPEGHADKRRCLMNLGTSFRGLFKRTGDSNYIDKAISVNEHAVRLIADGHAAKPIILSHLGESLLLRFNHTGKLADIDNSILAHENAVRLSPEGHTNTSERLLNLGYSFNRRFQHSGNRRDFDMAVSKFRLSASSSTGHPDVRFNAALYWARLAFTDGALTSLQGYDTALNLLPRVAWLGQKISTRHQQLFSAGGIGNEAAAAAIGSGKYEKALEWLEQGRSVIWSQLLNLRTPVDKLRDADCELADDLGRISKLLEYASARDNSPTDRSLSVEQAAQQHRRLAKDWDMLVERARTLPGLEDFLLPKKFGKLSEAAQSGPVVVINVHKSRCDALIVIADLKEVIHVPLNDFSYDQAQELQHSLNKLLSSSVSRQRDTRHVRRTSPSQEYIFKEILSKLWIYVVKPVLDALAFSVCSDPDPPRIWWCPTGPLAFLPIHAAGLYNTCDPGYKLSEFVTSSYTYTLTALLQPLSITQQSFQGFLGVGLPQTPGQSHLPNVEKELAHIKKFGSSLGLHCLLGEEATVESVVKGMEQHSWVHIACHAVQDTIEPTQSAFCLQNGHLTLSEIITKSFPHADFTFLSACETATGDENLPEEAVHLAAGMLAAGYRSVIATMWSIMDDDAPLVAAEVYSHLICSTEPDSTQAAHALHHAVKKLREQLEGDGKSSFLSWVPFIHVGM